MIVPQLRVDGVVVEEVAEVVEDVLLDAVEDVRRGAGDERRARFPQRPRRLAHIRQRRRRHVRPPVRADEGTPRMLPSPAGHARREVGEGDSGTIAPGGKGSLVVGEGEDRQAADNGGRARLLDILAGAGVCDPSLAQVLEGIEQRVDPVVECVVVRQGDAVDAEVEQRLDRREWRAEVERLLHRLAPLGDAALEVEDEEIGAACDLGQLGVDERLWMSPAELLPDGAPEHRVAGERDPHANPCRPWRRTKCAPLIVRTCCSTWRRFSNRTTSSSPPGPSGCTSRPPSASC